MRWIVLVAFAAGCYSPTLAPCSIECVDGTCPAGGTCSADGFCHDDETEPQCPGVEFNLTVHLDGTGANTIGETGGFTCPGGSCTVSLARGRHVLVATPDTAARVTSWTLEGTDPTFCDAQVECPLEIDLQADTSVTAQFDAARGLTIDALGDGSGSIAATVDGAVVLTCTTFPCAARLPPDTTVALTATATEPSEFLGFAGCAAPCSIALGEDETVVVAQFEVVRIDVLPIPSGGANDRNSVEYREAATSLPTSVCPDECTLFTAPSQKLAPRRLVAVPGSGFQFSRWISQPASACDLTPQNPVCDTTFTDDTLIVAVFEPSTLQFRLVMDGNGTKAAISVDGASLADCGSGGVAETCTHQIEVGATVTVLTAPNNPVDWGGNGCPNQPPSVNPCVFEMQTDILLHPAFASPNLMGRF